MTFMIMNIIKKKAPFQFVDETPLKIPDQTQSSNQDRLIPNSNYQSENIECMIWSWDAFDGFVVGSCN